MTFIRKIINKNDNDYVKYLSFLRRYLTETPKHILNKHNYRYDKENIGSTIFASVDEENLIYLLLVHFEDFREYETPMAWILVVEEKIILFNCAFEDEIFVEENKRYLKESYFVEPMALPEFFLEREQELKRYIADGLVAFSKTDSVPKSLMFEDVQVEVVFDVPYVFLGNQN
ncbi:MAG: hypothetical protein H6997_10125 [Moraxellaceae bacterium]|nr:hypothetical protein [Moraxellaceae bacterium]